MRINIGRVILGGTVSAIVLFIASGIINGAVLGSAWQEWLRAMGNLNHAPAEPVGFGDLGRCLPGVWFYRGLDLCRHPAPIWRWTEDCASGRSFALVGGMVCASVGASGLEGCSFLRDRRWLSRTACSR
jgi:hypothetical protein